jgi:GTPase Era involved in 16S rRNA processing
MEEQKSIREIPNKITITVIGNRYSGKTTLLNSLIFPQIINNNNYTKTYGYDIRFLQINDNTIIKFFDIGDLELEPNENVFQSMSWYSHYVMYIIEPKIKESLQYLDIFEDVFKKNNIILVFNKIDQVEEQNYFKGNKDVQKFIQKYDIKNIFHVNSTNENSVKDFKEYLFNLIQNDIFNKIFKNIHYDDFNKNPILFHKAVIGRSQKIGC